MGIRMKELVFGIFIKRKGFFDGSQIQMIFFESDRFAILLVIAFTVKNIVQSGKSHANILIYPIVMGIAFIEP